MRFTATLSLLDFGMMRISILGGTVLLSMASLACSAAPEPIAKGSASFKVDYPTDPDIEGTCNATTTGGIGSEQGVPDLPSAGQELTEDFFAVIGDFGGQIIDGQTGSNGSGKYDIECTVKGDDSYAVDITISGPNTHDLAGLDVDTTMSIELNGTIESNGVGTGKVTVYTPSTSAVSPLGMETCELLALPDPNDSTRRQIGGGEATLLFRCPNANSALDDFSACETRGTIRLVDCLEE